MFYGLISLAHPRIPIDRDVTRGSYFNVAEFISLPLGV
jgi:hypothetical protein